VKRILLFGLLLGMMTASTGCGLFQAIFCYQPCPSCNGCGPCACGDSCDDGCGPACGPARRPIRGPTFSAPRRAVVADCDDGCGCDVGCGRPCRRANCGSCDPCSDPCGSGTCGRTWHRGPLSCLFALLAPCTWCGPSCGERYWGDFYSDPPDVEDPCDCYGNYSGGGCRSCGGSPAHAHGYATGEMDYGMSMGQEGELVPQSDRIVTPAPRPAGTPHRAARPPSPQMQ
jgi:hypothetical protein